MRAGARAVEVSAYVEALRHFERASALLDAVADEQTRSGLELSLELARGTALTAVQGYATTAVARSYSRALELCANTGNDAQRFAAVFGSWRVAVSRPDFGSARSLADQFVERALRNGAPELLLTAHGAAGLTQFFAGDFAQAERELRTVISLYEPAAHRAMALRAGQDPALACMMWSAMGLWLRGLAADARAQYAEALSRAHALRHTFTLAYTLRIASMLEHAMQDWTRFKERATDSSGSPQPRNSCSSAPVRAYSWARRQRRKGAKARSRTWPRASPSIA